MIPWIKTKVAGIFGHAVDARYKKLKPILSSQKKINRYAEIFYVGGFRYTDNNYQAFQNRQSSISDFLQELPYDTQSDNVEIYLIRNESETFLMSILDPIELFEPERILTLERVDSNIDFDNKELIYRH